jgi:hypothetical protein
MSLRWELTGTQPDNVHTCWFLLNDDQERLALLSLQQPVSAINAQSAWQRVEIAPETWLVAGATLELLPGVQAWRLSQLHLPLLRDGPLSLTFPPLP